MNLPDVQPLATGKVTRDFEVLRLAVQPTVDQIWYSINQGIA